MVPGKGNVSKGKGAANSKGSVTKGKRERISEAEDSDEEVSLPDVRCIDYTKLFPRFTASKLEYSHI